MRAKDTRAAGTVLTLALSLGLCFSGAAMGQKPASANRPEKSPVGKPAAALRDLFQDLDTNADKVIEKHEVPESALSAFETLLQQGDADNNGKLEVKEFRALLGNANPKSAGTPAQRDRRFKALDKNGDGKIDKQEFPGAADRFARRDRNGDGFLDRDELSPPTTGAIAAKATPKAARKNVKREPGSDAGKDLKADAKTDAPGEFKAKTDAEASAELSAKPRAKAKGKAAARPALDRLMAMDTNGDARVSREEYTGRPAVFDRLDTNRDGYLDRADRKNAGKGKKTASPKASSPQTKP